MCGLSIILVTMFRTATFAQFLNAFLSTKREGNKVLKEVFDNYIVLNLSDFLEIAHRLKMMLFHLQICRKAWEIF